MRKDSDLNQQTDRFRQSYLLVGLLVFLPLLSFPVEAQPVSENKPEITGQFRTGEELEARLQKAVSVTFSNVPLRDELAKFSRHEGIGIFIDRRIDPSLPISLIASNVTFEQILWDVAEQNQLGVCRIGDFYYLGPLETAHVLPVLWQAMKAESTKLKRNSKLNWEKKYPVNWPMLSQPGLIFERLASDQNLSILAGNKEQLTGEQKTLPHDVWPAIDLPELSMDEQIALLAVGFNLWFKRNENGNEVSLVEFLTVHTGQVEWRAPSNIKQKLPELREKFATCKLSLRGQILRAAGPISDLAAIEACLVRMRSPQKGTSELYTLSTLATRKQILETIAHRIGRKLEYASDFERTLDVRVELNVKNVDLNELIQQTLRDSNLKFELRDDKLVVFN